MRYAVLATDYDGTLATQGRVDPPTLKRFASVRPGTAFWWPVPRPAASQRLSLPDGAGHRKAHSLVRS
jgi:hypothetical protein